MKGPDRGATVRAWLDALSPDAPLMRRSLGELELAGLSESSCRHIAAYHFDTGRQAHKSQSIALERPHQRLAPRYAVTCQVLPAVTWLPKKHVLHWSRRFPC